ncbi:GntR family transcriptional regulator [Mycolicibacterium agri]|nr:GntR family transcriptional regulator [Mycolicibacterium agri]
MSLDLSELDIRSQRVGEKLTAYFERLIALGELKPGGKLPPERQIAQSLGVSRASVRDAMQELAHKGLIERRTGRGTIVLDSQGFGGSLYGAMDRSERSVAQVVDLRQAIEPAIAAAAAQRATPANLLQLKTVLDTSHAHLPPTKSMQQDYEFHLLIAQATQNPLLVTLITTTEEWLSDARRASHSTKAGRAVSVAGHRRIYEAIAAKNAEAARLAMMTHLNEVAVYMSERRNARKHR